MMTVKKSISLACLAVLIMCQVYIFVLAENRYVSNGTFTLKSQSEGGAAQMSLGILTGAAPGKSDQLMVRDFILSEDMMTKVFENFSLEHLSAQKYDFWWMLDEEDSLQKKLAHYRSLIKIRYDEESSITRIEVSAFSPEAAYRLNKFLLKEATDFVNAYVERINSEFIAHAQKDVDGIQKHLDEISDQLTDYQNASGVLDPSSDNQVIISTLSELESKITQEKAKLNELQGYMAADSLQISIQTDKVRNLEKQVENVRSRLVGVSDAEKQNLAEKAKIFADLKRSQEQAVEALTYAMRTLENAKMTALQSRKSMLIIDQPGIVKTPQYPNRLMFMIASALSLLMCAVLMKSLIAIIKEY